MSERIIRTKGKGVVNMKQEILQKLAEPFNVKTKPGKGNYKYIDSKDVIERMNNIFKGSWSTNIRSEEVVEDQILIRVNVQCYDSEIEQWVQHDGYGSSPIARFGYGDNKGKVIDIGNSYKGALSKAIRSACTRLGVGLNLEVSAESGALPGSTPPSAVPEPPTKSELPTFPSDTPTVPAVEIPVTPEPVPEPAPVVEEPVNSFIPPEPTAPPVPYEPETVETPTEVPTSPVEAPPAPVETRARPEGTPMTPAERIKEKKDREGGVQTAPPQTTSQPPAPAADVDYMSDVQFAALDGVLGIKGLKYEELAKEAFSVDGRWAPDTVPTDPRQLRYEQAVVVIKYGNDKNRQLA